MMSNFLEKRQSFSKEKEEKLSVKEACVLIVCGAIIGFLNGFFGGGG